MDFTCIYYKGYVFNITQSQLELYKSGYLICTYPIHPLMNVYDITEVFEEILEM